MRKKRGREIFETELHKTPSVIISPHGRVGTRTPEKERGAGASVKTATIQQ